MQQAAQETAAEQKVSVNPEFVKKLEEIVGREQISLQEPMSKHTTFRAGGECDYFVSPSEISQIKEIINLCHKEQLPYYIIGNGSNLLVSDNGYRGVMIHLGPSFAGCEVDEEAGIVTVKAGAALGGLVRMVSRRGLGDMTWAAGIPGSFGGAVVMNAGAYGGELKQVLMEVTWLEEDGSLVTAPASELGLGYRQSIFKHSRKIVLEGKLKLEKADPEKLMARIEALNQTRREKQPLEYPSAGSTFKRPEGYFAGKLIEDSGLRGYRLGGAQVSEKHCGFVINRDNATASDLYKLFQHIKAVVRENFQVEMELEVELIGEF
ncbi:MAG: UDP-N-acetylmuramate dehydrogenase [Lachnospiraceae bacterium]|nr:UDP-N-acetylmuramate dehydrogenase [Lachnospiraceae bacterium]